MPHPPRESRPDRPAEEPESIDEAELLRLLDDDGEAEAQLDHDFPLGDGTADDVALVTCPYCGESGEIALDAGSGAHQSYVEDCWVCCQPWQVVVHYLDDGSAHVSLLTLDDG